jgi:hypothetical protein
MISGQAHRFADISEQHVRPLHRSRGLFIRASNSFFHQAFPQPNAQIAADDFDRVLGLSRGATSASTSFAAEPRSPYLR